MFLKKSALVIASLLVAGAAQAVSFSNTGSLSVSINVTAGSTTTSCSFSAPMGGGTTYYSSTAYVSGPTAAQATGMGFVNIACNGTDATPYTVNAGSGNNATATSRRARLGATSDYIDYNLTTFAGMNPSAPWGDSTTFGSGITGTTSGNVSNTAGVSFNLVVPASQTAPTGIYTDTVVLTATF